ncbi:MAG: RimK/LysX family protein [Pirellulales bacterium]|nr:RimK/LysX family protein [Pirellulales bacterium]
MVPNRYATAVLLLALPLLFAVLRVKHHGEEFLPATPVVFADEQAKRVIGPVVTMQELESGLCFAARVDTGAKRCSLHATEWTIAGGLPAMEENVGKTIRFRIVNRQGESAWLERPIAEVAFIRTSEKAELRYLVPLTFSYKGNQRKILVSLNDRSQMSYSMLLGRNFLKGQYLVDVDEVELEEEVLIVSR